MNDFYQQLQANLSEFLIYEGLSKSLFSTALLVLSFIILRILISRYLKKQITSADLRRKWHVQLRNGLILILIFGLVIIWSNELRTFALSLVAIAVAFVVATKELILCITGSILKTGARSFNIGDRIQIKDFRGDVIDQNLLATTILEVGPGKLTHQRTGRMAVIPNALFVSEPLINESFTHDYVLHVFTIPLNRKDDWKKAQKITLASANKHCKPYLDDVRKHMRSVSEDRGLEVPSVEPRVTIQIPTSGEIHLVVRVAAKSGERSFIEQSILIDVLSQIDIESPKIEKE